MLKDPEAPVDFYIGGKKVVDEGDGRVEVKNLGNGKHQLIVHSIKMSDGPIEARTPSNRGDEIVSSCKMNLIKGEEGPEMGDLLPGACVDAVGMGECGPVVGIARKNCNWSIGYQVEGKQQSPLECIVIGPNGD